MSDKGRFAFRGMISVSDDSVCVSATQRPSPQASSQAVGGSSRWIRPRESCFLWARLEHCSPSHLLPACTARSTSLRPWSMHTHTHTYIHALRLDTGNAEDLVETFGIDSCVSLPQTPDMQWTYEVRGMAPAYTPPLSPGSTNGISSSGTRPSEVRQRNFVARNLQLPALANSSPFRRRAGTFVADTQ